MTERQLNETGITFATSLDGEPVTFGTADAPHLAVFGSCGTGKTVAVQGLVTEAIRAGWDVSIIDVVKGALDYKRVRPWQFRGQTATTVSEALDVVRSVYETMASRYADPTSGSQTPVLLVVDDFSTLLYQGHDESHATSKQRAEMRRLVSLIMREGRGARIHVVIAAQRIHVEDLHELQSPLAENFARLLMGNTNYPDRCAHLRNPNPSMPSGRVPLGQGIFEAMTGGQSTVQVSADPFARLPGIDQLAG